MGIIRKIAGPHPELRIIAALLLIIAVVLILLLIEAKKIDRDMPDPPCGAADNPCVITNPMTD